MSKSFEKRRAEGDREVSAAKRAAGIFMMTGQNRVTRDEWQTRLAEIPADTRDLTARICGDPLPGRRAIDRRAS